MHLFLAWRAMEDHVGTLGYTIERILWGDSRARHTFLIACTDEYPLFLIEIDMGDEKKGIHKSMKLNLLELEQVPDTICKVELIGETHSPTAFDTLIRSAKHYVEEHPHYNALLNNCRTFVEYVIDQIPEFRNSVPRKHGSVLEYYHSRAKMEHPGAIVKSKKLLKNIRDFHRSNREYKYAEKLVLDIPSTQKINNNDIETIET